MRTGMPLERPIIAASAKSAAATVVIRFILTSDCVLQRARRCNAGATNRPCNRSIRASKMGNPLTEREIALPGA